MLQYGQTLKNYPKHKRSHIVQFDLYKMSRIGISIKTESQLVVARGWGWWKMGE